MMQTRANSFVPCFLQLSTFYAIFLTCTHASRQDQPRQEHIVYMGDFKSTTLATPPSILHSKFLEKALDLNYSASILYSHKSVFNCFVALLNDDEVRRISSMEEVVSVFPNRNNRMQTSQSWDYMGFFPTVKGVIPAESNVIVGVIDSGIWPESPSFSDEGFGPPPTKWNGSCSGLTDFTCNNKIIGARYYKNNGKFSPEDIRSPRDTIGHGTQVTSIIAGNIVNSASYYGLGKGTARGGVPSSRIAVYKVCWSDGCLEGDIIEAFADAIKDGVDIISISLGDPKAKKYFNDGISIGSFKAMRHGILTVLPAGNTGLPSTVSNVFPWALSVGASTISRKFITNLQLDNAKIVAGGSINTFNETGLLPLVYGGDAPNKRMNVSTDQSRLCEENSLDTELVQGKIVVCDKYNTGVGVLSAGAKGMVILGNYNQDETTSFVLPTTYIFGEDASDLMKYLYKEKNPRANIFKTNEGFESLSPSIASFSSLGPSLISPQILKPDLCAPGVKILVAWIPKVSPTREVVDRRTTTYNIMSGTSLASPHVAAAAAYVKSFYPLWSPGAIKSALITTVFKMNPNTSNGREFAYGAGHVNPVNAVYPGLVYNATLHDYVQFLCVQGYTTHQLRLIIGENIYCHQYGTQTSLNLNMPSFAIPVHPSTQLNVTLSRKVTNVGSSSSNYDAMILSPRTLKIKVVPKRLVFSSVGQTLPFTVTLKGIINREMSASLTWVSSGSGIQVRSPIVVFFIK